MQDFQGKIAVVTGGGTGMGRELVCQLVAAGAHVAMCDVSAENMQETVALAELADGQRLTQHLCDVASEQQMLNFRDEVAAQHETDCIHLLFNNAGIGGGGGFVEGDREHWERVFGVCWYGVYYGCRAFMDMLVASDAAHVINTSSVNGFWASIGMQTPHTSYAAAKFAVKGFTEALITDLRLHAPHVKVSLVMPGHIGTSIAINSRQVLQGGEIDASEVADIRARLQAEGHPVDNVPDEHIMEMMRQRAEDFRDLAPTTAASAAKVILDGVQAGQWRILIGDDAHALDRMVRENPEIAYEQEFFDKMQSEGVLVSLVGNAQQ